MPKDLPTNRDEADIDIIKLLIILWSDKWKIVGVAIISSLSMFAYQSYQPQADFMATTIIKPINSVDAERYKRLNSIENFKIKPTINSVDAERYERLNSIEDFKVTPDILMKYYIEELDERELFEEAIRKYEILDLAKFEDEQAFNEAVTKFAHSINLLPQEIILKDEVVVPSFWSIEVKYNDENKWKQVLTYVNSSANQNVRKSLLAAFKNSLSEGRQKLDYQVMDTERNIKNAILDYERETAYRLFFLEEQSVIAKKLGLAKSSLEVQKLSNQQNSSILTNLQTDTPYYLRGYEAIDMEIELIKTRTDKEKKGFITNYLEFEKTLRILKQDDTIQRANSLISSSPIITGDEFMAASVKVNATKFKTKTNRQMLMMLLAAIFGGVIASLYVFISHSIKERRELG